MTPLEPAQRARRIRNVGTLGLIIALTGGATSYAARPTVVLPGRVSVVALLESAWPWAMGAAAVALIAAAALRGGHIAAHALAAGVLAAYAVALWAGALTSDPTAPWASASVATALALHALMLTAVHAGKPWTPR